MLYTKSILLPKSNHDGIRVSVMSRHTLDDGVTFDPRITSKSYNVWRKDLAPPDNLVGKYYRGEVDFRAYMSCYTNFLRAFEKKVKLIELGRFALTRPITLLCIEEDALKCHRSTLANECARCVQGLEVKHR